MSNVIKFPSRPERQWTDMEKILRSHLQKASAPEAMEEELMTRMRAVFMEYHQREWNIEFQLPVPAGMSETDQEKLRAAVHEGFAQLASRIHELTNHVFCDRVSLEIELYNLRNELDKSE